MCVASPLPVARRLAKDVAAADVAHRAVIGPAGAVGGAGLAAGREDGGS